jgi:L-amino acid N-acyltransferase YncA
MTIRDATLKDLPTIVAIYNAATDQAGRRSRVP